MTRGGGEACAGRDGGGVEPTSVMGTIVPLPAGGGEVVVRGADGGLDIGCPGAVPPPSLARLAEALDFTSAGAY